MLDNLKKKKMLESLGVNKTSDTSAPNDIYQDKDVVKHATDFPGSKHKNIGKNTPPSMSKNPLKQHLKDTEMGEKESIQYQKKEMTLGKETKEVDDLKKKKMLESLFKKR